MSEQAMNIYQRLAQVMGEVSYIQKEKKAEMKYSIVSHDAVTAKVRPVLLKAGIVYHPINMEWQQNGNRTEVTLSVRFVNIDQPNDYMDVPALGFGIDQQDKGPGKAISYAVKYALLKALGLETGDDPDQEQQVVHETAEEQAKARCERAVKENLDSVNEIKDGIANGDYSRAAEAWFELDRETQKALWLAPTKGGVFSTDERHIMKTQDFRQAYYGTGE